jgi:hypothetical protein
VERRESIDSPPPIPQKRNPLMGVTTLFPLIRQVADLCSKVRATPMNSAAIISEATVLQNKLQAWSPTNDIFSDTHDDPNNIPRIVRALITADSHRYATLLYLYQAVPELHSPSSKEIAKKILKFLADVPAHLDAFFVQPYPLLVAGCEADDEEDREWVGERWQVIAGRVWVDDVHRCWEITQEVWKRRDAAKACGKAKLAAHGDQHQLPNTQQAGNSMEKMDPELTVRGRLHWAGVVKDWGWEVSF